VTLTRRNISIPEALAALEQHWSNLRWGPCSLTDEQVRDFSANFYADCVRRSSLDVIHRVIWDVNIGANLWTVRESIDGGSLLAPPKVPDPPSAASWKDGRRMRSRRRKLTIPGAG
jgi:hypothetical protein